jgi:hypothetical protein
MWISSGTMRTIGPVHHARHHYLARLSSMVRSRTILFVQLLDFKSKLSLFHNLIVEFVPSADCCILGAGEGCQWMEVKSVYNQTQEVADPQDC